MSDYNVKYRPQKISELDLVSIRDGLAKVLKSGKIPHAYLFAGPRGIGKTSAARIVAKAVNCVGKKKEDFEPCNSCPQCLSITAGTNLDVLEIDAASNRGIDDIRDLREKVKLAPSAAFYKVYIIDEVHMLTTEAFNALLKTLEEPPKHVIFILCTTEPEKLPATIISRCTRFNFKKANEEEVIEKLKRIALEESLKIKPEAIVEIARGASGSFRDALKILELATFSEDEIGSEQIKEILGQTAGLVPGRLLEEMLSGDTQAALSEIKRVVESGANLRIYTEQLLEILRSLLLKEYGLPVEVAVLDATYEVADLRRLIEIFTTAARELKDAIIPQLPLELAVVQWCEEDKGAVTQSSPKSDSVNSGAPEPALDNKELHPRRALSTPKGKDISLGDIQSRWKELLSAVRPRNFSIEAFLRASRPLDFDGKILTVEVFYQFHRDKLESERCRAIVEEVAAEVFGSPLGLKYVLGQRPKTIQNTQAKTEDIGELMPSVDLDGPSSGEEDILQVAEEIFNGRPN